MLDTRLDRLRRRNADVLRVHHAAARLYFLGPRVLAEFLVALAAVVGTRRLLAMLLPFLRLTPQTLGATGTDRVLPPPLRRVA